ncbi:MAG: cellulase family glycosylhydrolase [Candidatus Handelsmanbacteria bacterium]|nr:cellulase family glycosylhydrolase [Candidatus Handelsmanbacteria bacterium]
MNSARIFLAYVVYEYEPKTFLNRIGHFVRAAHERGISVMPVLWDSCFDDTIPTYTSQLNKWIPNPGVQRLTQDFWPDGERYCQDVVRTLGSEPGLLMWDVMKEPLMTSWLNSPEKEAHVESIWTFVRHFCTVVKRLDSQHPITVGVPWVADLPPIASYVDVLSFHDYRPTRTDLAAHIADGLALAKEYGKPVLLSEIGCLARINPYDMTLEVCQKTGIGWYLWELMIGVSVWRDIHGVVYPDGTVRDPSIAAAIRGFFRKRTGEIILPNVDKEGHAARVSKRVKAWI